MKGDKKLNEVKRILDTAIEFNRDREVLLRCLIDAVDGLKVYAVNTQNFNKAKILESRKKYLEKLHSETLKMTAHITLFFDTKVIDDGSTSPHAEIDIDLRKYPDKCTILHRSNGIVEINFDGLCVRVPEKYFEEKEEVQR